MSILSNNDDYKHWRDDKLTSATTTLSDFWVQIKNPKLLSAAEKIKIAELVSCGNFVLLKISPQTDYETAIISINQQLKLRDFDQHLYAKSGGLAQISISKDPLQSEFIPYTDKKIGWHTDGYYNKTTEQIRAFSLFCVNPAKSGGENCWIDPEIVYILLREENPEIAAALTHPEALTIPEHRINGVIRRPASTTAIFSIDEVTNTLSMRYTQRKKHIKLLPENELRQAIAHLDQLLSQPTEHHFCHQFKANQGIICNNILHNRSTFTDDPENPRLLLRGRYFNRICPT